MRQLGIRLAALAIPIVVVLLLAEIALRLYPSLIGEAALARFPRPLRQTVAQRLDLPTNDDTVEFATADRADHGPPLRHAAPNSTFRRLLDKPDADAGALERMRMDANGYCNPPEKAMRTSADIVTLGDSFTFCNSVLPENSAAAKLEELTGRTTYNLGVGGTGPYDYIEFLRHDGLKLKPKAVVMNIYEGNDLRDTLLYRRFVEKGNPEDSEISTGDRLLSTSYALSFLTAGWKTAVVAVKRGTGVDFRYTVKVQGKSVPMNVADADPDEVANARRLLKHEIDFEGFAQPLQSLAELAKENDFQPLVTYIPSLYTAYGDSVEFQEPQVGRDVQAFSDMQRQWLKDEAVKLDLPFLDFTPALKEAAKDSPALYFPANVHLTPVGHLVLAHALAAKLAELGLGPAKAATAH